MGIIKTMAGMWNNMLTGGYTLAAGSTFTFTISGQLTLGPASQMQSNGQAVVMQPPFAALIVGNLYNINLFGMSWYSSINYAFP